MRIFATEGTEVAELVKKRCATSASFKLRTLKETPAALHAIHDLRDTKAIDVEIARLATLRRAQLIDLRGTQVTPEGVAKLRSALPWCRIVLTEADSVMLREKKLEGAFN